MAVYKVEICGVNTAKLPILKEAEKQELLKRMQAGDRQAREQYIRGNLRLVLSVIQRFSASGENVDDLFQIGCIGLIKAIDNFQPDAFHVKFSTYAVPMNSSLGKNSFCTSLFGEGSLLQNAFPMKQRGVDFLCRALILHISGKSKRFGIT